MIKNIIVMRTQIRKKNKKRTKRYSAIIFQLHKKIYFVIPILLCQLASAQNDKSVRKLWTLQECISYATENNITVKDAALNQQTASVNYDAAKASRLPNLSGSMSQNFSNGNTIDRITSDYVSQQIASTNVGLNSSVTLFQGNQINNKIGKNELLLQQSNLAMEEIKNNIRLSILQNYLQALYNKESITTAQNNLKVSEEQLTRSKELLKVENITLKDYAEAQSQVASNKYKLIQAKNNYQQYIIALKQLLELPVNEEIDIQSINYIEDNIVTADKVQIYYNALKYLPEIEASKLNIEINKKDLNIAKGAYLPTLSLSGSLGSGYTSINDNSFFYQMDVNFNQRIGLNLSIPIFNRKATKSSVQKANINIAKAEIQQKTAEKTLFKKIDQTYQNALSAKEQLDAAKSAKEAAQQSFDLAKQNYELGGISTTDWVVSQNTFATAQQNYLQAKYMNILYHQLLQYYQGKEFKL